MQRSGWVGVLVLGIVLTGFVFAAGCPWDPCDDGVCGTWYSLYGPPTNAPVIPARTLDLHPDMTFTLTVKTFVQQGEFGHTIPGPDNIFAGTWERLNENKIMLKGQSPSTEVLVLQYEPGVPRLVAYGVEQAYYRNQNDWIRWTDRNGKPNPLPA